MRLRNEMCRECQCFDVSGPLLKCCVMHISDATIRRLAASSSFAMILSPNDLLSDMNNKIAHWRKVVFATRLFNRLATHEPPAALCDFQLSNFDVKILNDLFRSFRDNFLISDATVAVD